MELAAKDQTPVKDSAHLRAEMDTVSVDRLSPEQRVLQLLSNKDTNEATVTILNSTYDRRSGSVAPASNSGQTHGNSTRRRGP